MGEGQQAERLRVLVVISAPIADEYGGPGPARLDVMGEWQGIARQLRGAKAPVDVRRLVPPTFEALQTALAQKPGYDIVHFIGHGAEGGVLLEDELGRADWVRGERLKDLFAQSGVKLAILNLCESAAGPMPVAQAVADAGVKAVIGTQRAIADPHALLLAERIYALLANGKTLGEALEGAKQALEHKFGKQAAGNVVLVGDRKLRLVYRAAAGDVQLNDGEPRGTERLPATIGFVGRRRELLEAGQRLGDSGCRGVILTGMGGIGKTCVAAEAGRRNCWRFAGVVFATAKDRPDFGVRDVLDEMTLGLGLEIAKIADEEQRARAALDVLNATAILLVLDNLETAEEAQRKALAGFLDGIGQMGGSKFVLGYREHLDEFEGLAAVGAVDVGPMDADAAGALVLREAGLRTPRVKEILDLGEAERRHELNDLVREAGCHPQVLVWVVRGVVQHGLKAEREFLRGLKGPWEKRVEDLIRRQIGLLGTEGRAVLMRLPIFVGSVDRRALESILGKGEALDEGLRQLGDASLVEYDGERGRWSLHQMVLDYARKNLPFTPDEEKRLREAAARHYADVAGFCRDNLSGEHALRALGLFEAELGNIRAAGRWAKESSDAELAVALGYRVRGALERLGLWAERVRWLREGLEAARRGTHLEEISHLGLNLGVALAQVGAYAEAGSLFEESLGIARELGNQAGVSTSLHQLGILAQDQGDYQEARRLYQESLGIKRELGNRAGVSTSLHQLGILAQDQGDHQEARRLYQESLGIDRELGDRAGIGRSLGQMGTLAAETGDLDKAAELYEEAAGIFREIGAKRDLAMAEAAVEMVRRKMGGKG